MRVLAVLSIVALGACTPRGVDPLPAPPTVHPRPSTTEVPDYSGVQLAGVPGRTTTTIAIAGGTATLNGSVTGPDGPVGAAVVHVERFVGDNVATADVFTNPDGTFSLPSVLGGRFRVRAYRPPDLALVAPEVFFLGGTDTKTLALELDRYQGMSVAAAIAPNPPVATEPANLLVQATFRSVDADGVVRAVPIPGVRVELFPTGRWTVEGAAVQFADTDGRALWRVRCGREGEQEMSVLVADGEAFPLSLPACAAAPPSTTSTTAGPTTTSSTTSTTAKSSTTTSSTTSTTRRGGGPPGNG